MSWSLFKSNILRQTQNGMDNIDDVASIWANEYDSCVKRGFDFLNQIPIQNGNKELAESLFKIALLTGSTSTSPSFSLVNEFGKGVVAYWGGAIMKNFPIPLIPAPGSIQNISVTSNNVINPGSWTPLPPIPPNNSASLMIDQFVVAATTHLLSVGGIINTISLYPSAPSPIPAPGLISWTGYTIPG